MAFDNVGVIYLVFDSVLQIIGRITSSGYSVAVCDIVSNKLNEKHSVLKHVRMSSGKGETSVFVDDIVNDYSFEEVSNALKDFIKEFEKLFGDYPFRRELDLYIAPHAEGLDAFDLSLKK